MADNNRDAAPKSVTEALFVYVWGLPPRLRLAVVILLLLGAGTLALPEWARALVSNRTAQHIERNDGVPRDGAPPDPKPPATIRRDVSSAADDDSGVVAISTRLNVPSDRGKVAWIGVRSGDRFYPLLEAASADPPTLIAAPPEVAEGQFVLVIVDDGMGRSFQKRLNDGESYSFAWHSFDQFTGTLELSEPFVRPTNRASRRAKS